MYASPVRAGMVCPPFLKRGSRRVEAECAYGCRQHGTQRGKVQIGSTGDAPLSWVARCGTVAPPKSVF